MSNWGITITLLNRCLNRRSTFLCMMNCLWSPQHHHWPIPSLPKEARTMFPRMSFLCGSRLALSNDRPSNEICKPERLKGPLSEGNPHSMWDSQWIPGTFLRATAFLGIGVAAPLTLRGPTFSVSGWDHR